MTYGTGCMDARDQHANPGRRQPGYNKFLKLQLLSLPSHTSILVHHRTHPDAAKPCPRCHGPLRVEGSRYVHMYQACQVYTLVSSVPKKRAEGVGGSILVRTEYLWRYMDTCVKPIHAHPSTNDPPWMLARARTRSRADSIPSRGWRFPIHPLTAAGLHRTIKAYLAHRWEPEEQSPAAQGAREPGSQVPTSIVGRYLPRQAPNSLLGLAQRAQGRRYGRPLSLSLLLCFLPRLVKLAVATATGLTNDAAGCPFGGAQWHGRTTDGPLDRGERPARANCTIMHPAVAGPRNEIISLQAPVFPCGLGPSGGLSSHILQSASLLALSAPVRLVRVKTGLCITTAVPPPPPFPPLEKSKPSSRTLGLAAAGTPSPGGLARVSLV